MYCRCLLKSITRCLRAVYEGFIEFCQRGCLVGSQYLVKPNYHPCERVLWFVIYMVWSSIGFYLIYYYMANYSENTYRIVTEEHEQHQPFRYPTLGICETADAEAYDMATFHMIEEALNNSLYKHYPILAKSKATNHFIHFMAYLSSGQLKHDGEKNYNFPVESYFNYTKTLDKDVQKYLEQFNYRHFIHKVTRSCTELFNNCCWLNKTFDCCEVFRELPTMLGKCFLFNSHQNYSLRALELINEIEIYAEPYYFEVKLKRPAKIFILNNRDIPETLRPLDRPKITADGGQLTLEFTTMPIISDESLKYLDPKTLRCIEKDTDCVGQCLAAKNGEYYPFTSYTICITGAFYKQQYEKCGCVILNSVREEISGYDCNLSQILCLEQEDLINPTSMLKIDEKFMKDCLPNCDDSEYFVNNKYSRPAQFLVDTRNTNSLEFILLNFPKTHKRRQVIRQIEDKLVSLSGILGLFMGLSVVSIIEFIYLTCCAFWKRNKNKRRQVVVKTRKRLRPKPQWARRVNVMGKTQETSNQFVYQP